MNNRRETDHRAPHRNTSLESMARDQAGRLYRMGLGFCGNHADAQDLVQETLLRAYQKWEQFEGRANPATWLYRIAGRVCLRMRRRRSGQPLHMESLEENPAFAERTLVELVSPETNHEALQYMQEAVAALPEEFRLPLVLKEIAGFSLDETARILGLKSQTVKTRVHRARLRLRQQLAKKQPVRRAQPPTYSRQICLDLLKAKQDALDRNVPFPAQNGLLCERCRTVLASLDVTHDLCHRLAQDPLPASLRHWLEQHQQPKK